MALPLSRMPPTCEIGQPEGLGTEKTQQGLGGIWRHAALRSTPIPFPDCNLSQCRLQDCDFVATRSCCRTFPSSAAHMQALGCLGCPAGLHSRGNAASMQPRQTVIAPFTRRPPAIAHRASTARLTVRAESSGGMGGFFNKGKGQKEVSLCCAGQCRGSRSGQ